VYYFKFDGHGVGCDSIDELRDALRTTVKGCVAPTEGVPMPFTPPGDETQIPTSTKTRARRIQKKKDKKVGTKGNPGVSAWRVAKLYAEKKGISPGEARTYLKKHPRVKARFVGTLE
jgi:hypothetical protein